MSDEMILLADAIVEDSMTAECGHSVECIEVCGDCELCLECCSCCDLKRIEQDFLNALRLAASQGDFKIYLGNFAGWQDTCSCEKCQSQIAVFEFIMGLTGQQMPEGLKSER